MATGGSAGKGDKIKPHKKEKDQGAKAWIDESFDRRRDVICQRTV
jgi:hypothetical protein